MKYLLIFLGSYALTYYIINTLIETRLQDMADALRHQPDAPTAAQFLREVKASAQASTLEYTLIAGTVIAALLSTLAWWLA
ncbi:hypothetical protein [Pseudomonas fontis]|uniref:Lipoprotein n=1 Tax=Pseudomonas fontis TaxID=2942633 RepID=A0ABT5NQ65_9PSED|nr:hypothetical protein [Pseudomonas fontis]MDD0977649.1 hypothetical protein [Pseudomonas fontis]MDD0990321.1 hypothetical protein [Pseudomonas fontis]